MTLKTFENGAWRDMTEEEFAKHQEDFRMVPRKVFKALLQALVAKGVFTAAEVLAFLRDNRD